MDKVQNLLILGAPRSGTSLISSIIGSHCDVAVTIEDALMCFRSIAGKKVIGNKLCLSNQIEFVSGRFSPWRYGFTGFKRRNISRSFMRNVARKYGFGMGHTGSRFTINDYMELPNIKMILIVRHSDAVLSSMINRSDPQHWRHRSIPRISIYRWCRSIEIMYEVKELLGDKALVMSFEDVLVHSEEHMRKVCKFLDIPFQKKMLDGYKYNWVYPGRDRIDKSKVKSEKHEKISVDVSQNYPDVWKMYLELKASGEI